MLLNISTTHAPAGDLGYLLHKHPDRVQSFRMPFGQAYVFYPEVSVQRCTASLLLDIDPVGLVRRGRESSTFALAEYVNDRPYVASSFMSVALVSVFKSATSGTCRERPELAGSPIPLEAWLPAVPAASRFRGSGRSVPTRSENSKNVSHLAAVSQVGDILVPRRARSPTPPRGA